MSHWTVYLSGEIHTDWKEVDAVAMAVARTPEQLAQLLAYVTRGELARGGVSGSSGPWGDRPGANRWVPMRAAPAAVENR